MTWNPDDCPGCRLASAITSQLSPQQLPTQSQAVRAAGVQMGQGEAKIDRERAFDREGLAFIICRLDELRQMAASHGLDLLGYLLDVAYTEANEMIRRNHPDCRRAIGSGKPADRG